MRHPSVHRQSFREEVLAMSERLVAEYAGQVPAGSVLRYVARCHEQLRLAGVDDGLVAAIEDAVRLRLADVAPAHAFA